MAELSREREMAESGRRFANISERKATTLALWSQKSAHAYVVTDGSKIPDFINKDKIDENVD